MPRYITIAPDQWTPRGEALAPGGARHKPMVVWSGIPGERAKVRVLGGGQHQDRAEWVEAREPSPHRVDPACEQYTRCGGCPWMHLDAAGQERAHRALARTAFDQEGWRNIPIDAWHSSPDGLADFRHVVKLGIGLNDMGKTKIGAWGRGTRRIIPIPSCTVAHPTLNRVMTSLAHHVLDLEVWPWEPEDDRGVLRAAVLRASRTTGQVLITLVAARRSKRLRDLAEAVAGASSDVCGVWLHLNNDPGNAIYQRDDYGAVRALPIVGTDTIGETLNGVEYRIGPGDQASQARRSRGLYHRRNGNRPGQHPRIARPDRAISAANSSSAAAGRCSSPSGTARPS